MASVLFQPVAGDDVAQVIGRTAVRSPLNGCVEVAGFELLDRTPDLQPAASTARVA